MGHECSNPTHFWHVAKQLQGCNVHSRKFSLQLRHFICLEVDLFLYLAHSVWVWELPVIGVIWKGQQVSLSLHGRHTFRQLQGRSVHLLLRNPHSTQFILALSLICFHLLKSSTVCSLLAYNKMSKDVTPSGISLHNQYLAYVARGTGKSPLVI